MFTEAFELLRSIAECYCVLICSLVSLFRSAMLLNYMERKQHNQKLIYETLHHFVQSTNVPFAET